MRPWKYVVSGFIAGIVLLLAVGFILRFQVTAFMESEQERLAALATQLASEAQHAITASPDNWQSILQPRFEASTDVSEKTTIALLNEDGTILASNHQDSLGLSLIDLSPEIASNVLSPSAQDISTIALEVSRVTILMTTHRRDVNTGAQNGILIISVPEPVVMMRGVQNHAAYIIAGLVLFLLIMVSSVILAFRASRKT